MTLKMHRLLAGAIIAVLLLCENVNAEVIAATGQTSLTAKFRSLPITVVVTTKKADPAAQGNSTAVVSKVDLAVGRSSLWVPPSSYLDLVDPRQATLAVVKDQIVLTIAGGDGADTYWAKIHFNQNRVQKRSLTSALVPQSPTEETRYWQRVLKDE